jgi:hypothetical protein
MVTVSTSRWHRYFPERSIAPLLCLCDCACVLCQTFRRALCNGWETKTLRDALCIVLYSMILQLLSRCNCLKMSSLKWMDLWLNVHYNYFMFQNRDLRSYEKWTLNNEHHYVWCRFISKPCFLFCMTQLWLHSSDSCTLVFGEYVNWEAIEKYLPVNYSKATIYIKHLCTFHNNNHWLSCPPEVSTVTRPTMLQILWRNGGSVVFVAINNHDIQVCAFILSLSCLCYARTKLGYQVSIID